MFKQLIFIPVRKYYLRIVIWKNTVVTESMITAISPTVLILFCFALSPQNCFCSRIQTKLLNNQAL